ncbi:hypothetical protein J6Q66_05865 [bacterium]|nr:hypothetical protein [bacterium]
MEYLIKNLTQKNEDLALKSAKQILDEGNFEAFEKLCEKSDFLFDFIKTNVCKRFYNAANKDNYKNVINFFKLYDDTYADVFIQILLKFQDDNLPKEMLELLLEGDENEQAYSAKFFEYMPCQEAINVLNDLAFEEFEPLSDNAILALAKINDRQCIEKAYQKLTSKDDFEVLQGIKILTTYPELSQLDKITEAALNCSMRENAAADIACAVDLYNFAIKNICPNNLLILNSIIIGLGEILPLSQIINYKIFDIAKELVNINYEDANSQIAQILLNMHSKFKLFYENEEYTYDEDVDTKNEIKKIVSLLQNQGEAFWNEQKDLIFDELDKEDKRIIAALNVIKEIKISNNVNKIINLTSHKNELIICLAIETLSVLDSLKTVDIQAIAQNITNSNISAIIRNFAK